MNNIFYRQGWVCPKCGAVMSPDQMSCVNCTGKNGATSFFDVSGLDKGYEIASVDRQAYEVEEDEVEKDVDLEEFEFEPFIEKNGKRLYAVLVSDFLKKTCEIQYMDDNKYSEEESEAGIKRLKELYAEYKKLGYRYIGVKGEKDGKQD